MYEKINKRIAYGKLGLIQRYETSKSLSQNYCHTIYT